MTNTAPSYLPTTLQGNSIPRKAAGKDPLHRLRLAIYVYFLLWIFEGALRKWILPHQSSPLLIIRDPVLMLIYFEAMRLKVFKINGLTTFLLVLGMLSVVISIGLFKSPPFNVTLFGVHANFLHLPLIFLLPQVIGYEEVKKMGSIILWLAPPMAVLVALQFLSPSGARVNAAAGGVGKMLETALDRIRPSGTFSFTNGLAEYSVFLTAFLFHHLLEKKVFSKISFLLAAPSLLVLIVMSGSRTVFGLLVLEILAVCVIWFLKPRFLQSSIKLVAIGAVVVLLIGSVGALRLGMDVIVTRFDSSGGVKEGFIYRFLDEFKKPIATMAIADPLGAGIGMGTNAATTILYHTVGFTLGESESDRIIMEMGPVLGPTYLLWRVAVLLIVASTALGALRKHNNTLPLLLATACANDVVLGQFGQTTVVGFAVLCAGFSLAAVNRRDEEEMTGKSESNALNVIPTSTSSYAEKLRMEIEQESTGAPSPVSETLVGPTPKKRASRSSAAAKKKPENP